MLQQNTSYKSLVKKVDDFSYTAGFSKAEVFRKLLRYVVYGFCTNGDASSELRPVIKSRDAAGFFDLLSLWVQASKEEMDKGAQFVDVPGNLHQSVVYARGGKGFLGQYFSPENLCECMARMQVAPKDKLPHVVTVCDPCSGSGRMLLAANAILIECGHKGYFAAKDIDFECVLMTVANLVLHGMEGEVLCGNALDPSDIRIAFRTNPDINDPLSPLFGIPHCTIVEPAFTMQGQDSAVRGA